MKKHIKLVAIVTAFIISFVIFLPVRAITETVVINHNNTDPSTIPQKYLNLAKNTDLFFNHQSVGYNILEGLDALQSQDSLRYSYNSAGSVSVIWFQSYDGWGDYTLGENTYPKTKINSFVNAMQQYGNKVKVSFMKFCYIDFYGGGSDFKGNEVWTAYKSAMLNLQSSYPNTIFIWTTAPLTTTEGGNKERDIFNKLVRSYVNNNGGYLLDIADIESYSPSGVLTKDSNGYPALYSGYASDEGHLNLIGGKKIAGALWQLMAKIVGWGSLEITPEPKLEPKSISEPTLNPEPISIVPNITTVAPGKIVKLRCSWFNQSSCKTIYYLTPNNKRFVFPNEKVYFSWFSDFNNIEEINIKTLSSYKLSGNMTYKPGIRLIKIKTDPKVYAISKGGILRWIKNEQIATSIYGNNWNKMIDDVSDSFFLNYKMGADINNYSDYNRNNEIISATNILNNF